MIDIAAERAAFNYFAPPGVPDEAVWDIDLQLRVTRDATERRYAQVQVIDYGEKSSGGIIHDCEPGSAQGARSRRRRRRGRS